MKEPLDIVIVGGVAGGATAAARARRVNESANITIVERGGYVSYANCGLPYFISGDIKERKKLLLQTPEGFYERLPHSSAHGH
jgi:NADPH-dependent 2,4-dienoyl-CoA reductase/sulfur reductase-like enzyme